ncbi:MAG: hypothetical protein WAR79_12170 [Melioribacteraceae bacterium]
MDSFYFEERKNQFLELHRNEKSARKLFFALTEIYDELSIQDDDNLKEAFFLEFIPYLFPVLNMYSAFGVEPNKTQKIINTIKKFYEFIPVSDSSEIIKSNIDRIENELNILKSVLDGNKVKGNLSFPVIEKSQKSEEVFGAVEYLRISINLNKKKNKVEFIITPSLPHIDEKLQTQIETSWNYSVNLLKNKFHKFTPNLEVTIQFIKKLGIYEGDSLGAVLTIGFIQELFKYYDLREVLDFENDIMITGSMNENGNIYEVGKKIIEAKSKIAFFSSAEKFLVPLKDFNSAQTKINELIKNYPNRNLELFPIKNINDILNRRDVVKIEKQNFIKWGSKKLLKNKLAVIFISLLIFGRLGYDYFNTDDNPYKIENYKGSYIIKNSKNEILWTKNAPYYDKIYKILDSNYSYSLSRYARIFNINDDGENEVLLTYAEDLAPLILFNSKGEEIWRYFHTDSIETKNEKFTGHFGISGIIDTVHKRNIKEVIICFQHNNYYPNGIIKLDLKTGKPVSKILWHPGGIVGAILNDFNQDGIKEIIAGGISNGMHKSFLFSIDHNKLEGTFPTDKNYKFINMKLADFNKYILFPISDMGSLYFDKYNAVSREPSLERDILKVPINEGNAHIYDYKFWYGVEFNRNLVPTHNIIGDNVSVERDKLVKNGTLNYPLTDTHEFREIIMNKIEYWNGEKFISFFSNKNNSN